ncbi:MAG: hypothetical protein JWO38_5525 [Gemmataceae bacterium]|nr:hypothetical protein [Gemmataceae bacterium]
MPGDVSCPTPGPHAAVREALAVAARAKTLACPDGECEKHQPRLGMTARIGGTTGRLVGRRAGGSLLLGAVIALATFAIPAETRAQPGEAPAPGSAPPAEAKAGTEPKDLYGDQGGEKVAAANARLPNTAMRARLEDTFLKLSNPRIGQTSGPGPKRNALLVDYEVVSRGKFDGGTLVLHTDDGGRAEVALKSIVGRDDGTIELVGVQQFGNIKIAKNTTFPTNVEMYVTRGDDRYDPPSRFMVSNSVVTGKMKSTTRARNWTPEEIERYTKPPPSYKNPNAHPTIGVDVPPLPTALGQHRYVDPDGRLLGLDYLVGDWDKRKTVWRLTPVYSADQPQTHAARSIARKGYAVAGAEVNMDKYVCGIRLLFRRVKPDGTLDAMDAYAGDWIGTPPTGEATKLVNDGRRVLGIHFQQGAIVDRFSLVVEGEAK